MADLGRWLSGDYRVPGFPEGDAADERTSEASGRDQEDS
jgi:endogenous inhibitor of DNA gyrase (YacG/DUF329 family)